MQATRSNGDVLRHYGLMYGFPVTSGQQRHASTLTRAQFAEYVARLKREAGVR